MDKKAKSKQMTQIVKRLLRYGEFEVAAFGDDVILNTPVEEWPVVSCLLCWHSEGFPLKKASAVYRGAPQRWGLRATEALAHGPRRFARRGVRAAVTSAVLGTRSEGPAMHPSTACFPPRLAPSLGWPAGTAVLRAAQALPGERRLFPGPAPGQAQSLPQAGGAFMAWQG